MNCSEAGISNDLNDKHFENAHDSIRVSLDPGSKVTEESDRQSEKHPEQSTSTEAGMQMHCSDRQYLNATASICVNFDPVNVTQESELHPSKEYAPRTSMEAGMQIDCNIGDPENELP
jgi:hypothetical protein